MRQRRLAIILVVMYALAMLRPGLPRLLFEINRAHIQADLCLQREIKNNTCKGSCFMRKQLQQEQQRERPLANLLSEQLQLTQLQPSMAWPAFTPVAADAELPPVPSDASRLDQHVADLPVPPPWTGSVA